ncbi:hypothetical protein JB92DRAFT_2738847, partial [Gautieria morchelliformis]
IEVYNSGCTRHITPYCEAVTDFKAISPKSFQAANKQSFNAVRTGEMVIDIPNGVTTSQLRLTEVLYSPEVGYTLVSVGRLDEAGFTLTFADGKCVLSGASPSISVVSGASASVSVAVAVAVCVPESATISAAAAFVSAPPGCCSCFAYSSPSSTAVSFFSCPPAFDLIHTRHLFACSKDSPRFQFEFDSG